MAWLEDTGSAIPNWVMACVRRMTGLRASPRLLVGICCFQMLVLFISLIQQTNRTRCSVDVPETGKILIECDTCHTVSLSMQTFVVHVGGGVIVVAGVLAVYWRDQRLLHICAFEHTATTSTPLASHRCLALATAGLTSHCRACMADGSAMLLFSLMIGLTAMLTALEAPVLEVAVHEVDEMNTPCFENAMHMLNSARDHATLASFSCLIDTVGAILAIRSKVSSSLSRAQRWQLDAMCSKCVVSRIAFCRSSSTTRRLHRNMRRLSARPLCSDWHQ
jgi:hypothetical protein